MIFWLLKLRACIKKTKVLLHEIRKFGLWCQNFTWITWSVICTWISLISLFQFYSMWGNAECCILGGCSALTASVLFLFSVALLHSHIISLHESNLILNLLDCCRIWKSWSCRIWKWVFELRSHEINGKYINFATSFSLAYNLIVFFVDLSNHVLIRSLCLIW